MEAIRFISAMGVLGYHFKEGIKMKRICFLFFIIIIVIIMDLFILGEEDSYCGVVELSTYYSAPMGAYDRLRLIPRSSAGMVCDSTTEGLMFYDTDNDQIFVCKDTGIAEWDRLGGIWEQADNGTIGDVYLSEGNSLDLFVGIGTNTPEFRLTLDKGAITPDGGILAIGTFGSGVDLVTSGPGTRLIWYPKKASFFAGGVDADQWDDANIGDMSIGLGYNPISSSGVSIGHNTTASKDGAVAIGYGTSAYSDRGIAVGYNTTTTTNEFNIAIGYNSSVTGERAVAIGTGVSATGYSSIAMGYNAVSSGDESIAIGQGVESLAKGEIALGRYNVVSGNSTVWVDSDPLFVVGNGIDALNRNNALTVLKDGRFGLNTTTPEFRLTLDKGAATPDGGILAIGDVNTGTTLLTSGPGTRLIWYPRKAAFRAGYVDNTQWDDVNIGGVSVAIGLNNQASMQNSIVLGENNDAIGAGSFDVFVTGFSSHATASHSIAIGTTAAGGDGAISLGHATTAEAASAASFGYSTQAKAAGSMAIGISNVVIDSEYSLVMGQNCDPLTDPNPTVAGDEDLFVIGNGYGSNHNAITVLGNGKVGIGTDNPQSILHVDGYIQIDTCTSAPPAADCGVSTAGRIIFNTTSNTLYMCTGINWVSKSFVP